MNEFKATLKYTLEEVDKILDLDYDICVDEVTAIMQTAPTAFDMINDAFCYGYMQGRKATLAELRVKSK